MSHHLKRPPHLVDDGVACAHGRSTYGDHSDDDDNDEWSSHERSVRRSYGPKVDDLGGLFELRHELSIGEGSVLDMAASGRRLFAATSDGHVLVYDMRLFQRIGLPIRHGNGVTAVCRGDGNTFVTASVNNSVIVWTPFDDHKSSQSATSSSSQSSSQSSSSQSSLSSTSSSSTSTRSTSPSTTSTRPTAIAVTRTSTPPYVAHYSISGHRGTLLSLHVVGDVLFAGGQDCAVKVLRVCDQVDDVHVDDVHVNAETETQHQQQHDHQQQQQQQQQQQPSSLTSSTSSTSTRSVPIPLSSSIGTRSGHALDTNAESPFFLSLRAHSGFVYALTSCARHNTLYSGSGDATIRVWKLSDIELALQSPDGSDIGHIDSFPLKQTHTGAVLCLETDTAHLYAGSRDRTVSVWDLDTHYLVRKLGGHAHDVICITNSSTLLFSGSADGHVKVWHKTTFECIQTLETGRCGAILSLLWHSERLIVAAASGPIDVWVPQFQVVSESPHSGANGSPLIRSRLDLRWRSDGCMDLGSIRNSSSASSASSSSLAQQPLQPQPHPLQRQQHHDVSIDTNADDGYDDGDDDGGDDDQRQHDQHDQHHDRSPLTQSHVHHHPQALQRQQREHMEHVVDVRLIPLLRDFVAFRSLSGHPRHRQDCFACAKWLCRVYQQHGLEAKLAQGADGRNPLVLARVGNDPRRPTITMYGHYDVMPSGRASAWASPPFRVTGRDGYLYGRGVTDDKGPLLAALCALTQLMRCDALRVNVRFVVEGEEESSSEGCLACIRREREWIGRTHVLLVSNNYWLGDDRPCLIYGLRGVVHMRVRVHGSSKNCHSGVEGGAFVEPMTDLLAVLASLVHTPVEGEHAGTSRVRIPTFYDAVRAVSGEEMALYDDVDLDLEAYRMELGVNELVTKDVQTLLMRRWREPTLCVHDVTTSGEGNPTIIPRAVEARVSMRLVPDQRPEAIVKAFTDYVNEQFESRNSVNTLSVSCVHQGDWWLADLKSPYWKAAEAAVSDVWCTRPMYTREGGTIPIIRAMEAELNAATILLPIGQASDHAHLPNERIRLENLMKGVDVFKMFFQRVAHIDTKTTTTT